MNITPLDTNATTTTTAAIGGLNNIKRTASMTSPMFRNKLGSLFYTGGDRKTVRPNETAFLEYNPIELDQQQQQQQSQLPSKTNLGAPTSSSQLQKPAPPPPILTSEQAKFGFLEYLRGNLTEEELMYIRNFPTLYSNLPEPKKTYLQMYIREAKGDFSHMQSSKRSMNSDDDDDMDDEDDYMDDDEFRYRMRISQSKSSMQFQKSLMHHSQQHGGQGIMTTSNTEGNSSPKKPQKSVGFLESGDASAGANQGNGNKKPLLLRRKSMVFEKMESMQGERLAGIKTAMEIQAEKQHKAIMKIHINRSLGNLRSKIYDNIALRKGNDPTTIEENSKTTNYENTKFFSSLAGIHSNVYDKITSRDKQLPGGDGSSYLGGSQTGSKYSSNSKNYISKSLKNLSIITKHQPSMIQMSTLPSSPSNAQSSNQSSTAIGGNGSTTNRPQMLSQMLQETREGQNYSQKYLYKRFFQEYADKFIRQLQDPYDPKLRSLLQRSDDEYNKFLSSYFKKVQIAGQNSNSNSKKTTATSTSSTNPSTTQSVPSGIGASIQSGTATPPILSLNSSGSLQFDRNRIHQFRFEGRDLVTLNKEQNAKEKRYIQEIGDLDNYCEKHMITSLQNLQQPESKPKGATITGIPSGQIPSSTSNSIQLSSLNTTASATKTLNNSSSRPANHSKIISSSRRENIRTQSNRMLLASSKNAQQKASAAITTSSEVEHESNKSSVVKIPNSITNLMQSPSSPTNSIARITPIKANQTLNSFNKASAKPTQSSFMTRNSSQGSLTQQPNTHKYHSNVNGINNNNNNQQHSINHGVILNGHSPNATLPVAVGGTTTTTTTGTSTNIGLGAPNHHASLNAMKNTSYEQTPRNGGGAAKRLELMQRKGYHIIKRNQSDNHTNKLNRSLNDDLIHDESDDASNASRTEATLDALYSESIAIQNRLVAGDNSDGIIRKLKQIIKLEGIKKNLIDANLYKLR